MLKKLADTKETNCTVLFSVASNEELIRLVSVAIESGAVVEIAPAGLETSHQGAHASERSHQREDRAPEKTGQGEKVDKAEAVDILAKYKRRSEKKEPKVEQEQKSSTPEAKNEQQPGESRVEKTPEPEVKYAGTVVQTPAVVVVARPEAKEEKEAREHKVDQKERRSEEEVMSFEEMLRLKEEAFSRKILE